MTAKEIYRIWAPAGKKWVDWVRPVPFVAMKDYSKGYDLSNLYIPTVEYLDESIKDAAIIVDLPGGESVMEGLALVQAGYRPIPVFNGTIEQEGARATVDNQSAGIALIWGAQQLMQMQIKEDARPAFLLDRNRIQQFKMEAALFDNSWDIYHQDLPSADYFLKSEIRKIIVVGQSVSKDLVKILYPFQKKNIQIYWTKGYEAPKKVTLRKPRGKDKD